MYILPYRIHEEFLATPSLIRIVESETDDVANLLIKASTLELKYISVTPSIDLRFFRVGARGEFLAYAIFLGSGKDLRIIWSVVEWATETKAIQSLVQHGVACKVFLYNEIAVNVAEAEFDYAAGPSRTLLNLTLYKRPDPRGGIPHNVVLNAFTAARAAESVELQHTVSLKARSGGWVELSLLYITDAGKYPPLSLFSSDEGAQQEQLGTWLIGHLQPTASVRSPQFLNGSRSKELTDLFLSYEYGYFLVESKTLSVLSRAELPNREKLKRDIEKDVRKAVRQLGGALRSIRRGLPIVDADGATIPLAAPVDAPHAIVLVPDLELLDGLTEFGGQALRNLARQHEAYFHFLDPKELLRVVQAGELTVEMNDELNSEIEAVDLYLARRFELALTRPDPNFQVLARAKGR